MIFRLQFSENAKPEIQNAYGWYEEQQIGLGERFLLAIDETFERILNHPFSFPQMKGIFRECYVGRFPFLVIYKIKGKTIYVKAVFHTSRNPKRKK